MNRTPNYEDCIKFVEKVMEKENKTLYNFQKEILKSFFEDKEIRVARGAGRTYLAKLYGLYIGSLYAENDYSIEPEIAIDYLTVMKDVKGQFTNYSQAKAFGSKDTWETEFECKGTSTHVKHHFNLDYYLRS